MLNRRFLVLLLAAVGFISLLSVFFRQQNPNAAFGNPPIHPVNVDSHILKGDAIMGKIGNETLKAELGRAAWKLLHTTIAKFPSHPTADEKTALSSYIHLFARLYPCGECATHFLQILSKFPPQVATRSSAAGWACHVHNEVNKSLKKPLFDCTKIGDFYDCGCGEEGEGKEKGKGQEKGGKIDVKVERTGGPTQGG